MVAIKRKVKVGMNVFECPICAAANQAIRKRKFWGTLFVPVTFKLLTQLRVSDSYRTIRVKCHERGHGVDMQIHAQTKRA